MSRGKRRAETFLDDVDRHELLKMGYYLAAPEHRPGWARVDRLAPLPRTL